MAERVKRGMVRVKFLALKEIIQNKLLQGYTIKLIYDELCNEGTFTGSYKSFSRYIKIYELNKSQKIKPTVQHNKTNEQETAKNNNQQNQSDERPFREADKGSDDLI